jgi:hypothetical protein
MRTVWFLRVSRSNIKRFWGKRLALQRAGFAHSVAMGQMTQSDEDGVFEQASAPSIRSGERARSFGPYLVRKRMQNAKT